MAHDIKTTYKGNTQDDGSHLVLNIHTQAQRGYAQTIASVAFCKVEDGWVSETHTVFQDLFITVNDQPAKRVTQKVLMQLHEAALRSIDSIKQRVEQRYGVQTWDR